MLRTKNNIVTVNHDFDFTFFGFFNQALKTAVHTVAHVNVADAVLAFGFAHMESTVAGRRELVSDVDNTVLHIQVVNGKPMNSLMRSPVPSRMLYESYCLQKIGSFFTKVRNEICCFSIRATAPRLSSAAYSLALILKGFLRMMSSSQA